MESPVLCKEPHLFRGVTPPPWRPEAAGRFAKSTRTGVRECWARDRVMCPSGAWSKRRRYQTSQGGGPPSLEPPAPGVRRPRPRRSRAPSRASTPSSRGRSWLAQAMIPPGSGDTDGLGQVGGIRVQVDLACAERCCPPSQQETAEGREMPCLLRTGGLAWVPETGVLPRASNGPLSPGGRGLSPGKAKERPSSRRWRPGLSGPAVGGLGQRR